MNGIVKNVVVGRNFGFIRACGTEFFFHRDDFSGHWDDLMADVNGARMKVQVEFEEQKSDKGPRAINVRRMDFPNQA